MGEHRTAVAPDYDTDFFAWTQHQAKLLRALNGQRSDLPETLDIDHVAEEIEDLGKAELRSVTSMIRQILVHLLKAASDDHANARAHWRAEVTAFQADLPGYYAPSMRQLIDIEPIWQKALRIAEAGLQEHCGALASDLPAKCPYSLAEIVSDDFSFDQALDRLLQAR